MIPIDIFTHFLRSITTLLETGVPIPEAQWWINQQIQYDQSYIKHVISRKFCQCLSFSNINYIIYFVWPHCRLPVNSPRFVPCDLVKNAPEDSLIPLEEEIIVDSTSPEENSSRTSLELKGQSPALITLVSPSTTSLSSAADGSLHGHRKSSSTEGSFQGRRRSSGERTREAGKRSCPSAQSGSSAKKRRSDSNRSTTPRRDQKSRRLRRTPGPYYPQMSWRRAHQSVQTRKREAKRRMSPYRSLEKNPGWTPLQKAIKVRIRKYLTRHRNLWSIWNTNEGRRRKLLLTDGRNAIFH